MRLSQRTSRSTGAVVPSTYRSIVVWGCAGLGGDHEHHRNVVTLSGESFIMGILLYSTDVPLDATTDRRYENMTKNEHLVSLRVPPLQYYCPYLTGTADR